MCFGSLSASYLFIPVWFARPLPRGPDNSPCGCQKMFPAERSSRRVSERHLRRGKTAFPASFQPGYKELLFFSAALLGSCSCLAWGVRGLAKDTTLLRLFSKPNRLLLGLLNIHLYQSAARVYFPFSLWFYCLEPLCFLTNLPPHPQLSSLFSP